MAGTAAAWTKQTEETLIQVCDAVRTGLPLARAFKSSGISERTGHNWREKGWAQIDEADASAGEEMRFEARFAVAVEAALIQFMGPLVRRINAAATGEGRGKGRGDWRAAKELLASRFPDEWSERTHVAKSQKVEVSGGIDHNVYSVRIASMTNDELRFESDRHDAVICAGLGGMSLDREISRHETALADLFKRRDQQRGNGALIPGNLARRPPVELVARVIEHEPVEILAAAKVARDKAGVAEVVAVAAAAPFEVHEEPRRRGIGYDQHGLAFNLSDEDLSL